MPQSAGTPQSVQDAIDEEGEGALTSYEGEGEVAAQHRRRLGWRRRSEGGRRPKTRGVCNGGFDTESNGEAEGSDAEGPRRCGTNGSSPAFEHGAEVRDLLRAFTSLDGCVENRSTLRIALQGDH